MCILYIHENKSNYKNVDESHKYNVQYNTKSKDKENVL